MNKDGGKVLYLFFGMFGGRAARRAAVRRHGRNLRGRGARAKQFHLSETNGRLDRQPSALVGCLIGATIAGFRPTGLAVRR